MTTPAVTIVKDHTCDPYVYGRRGDDCYGELAVMSSLNNTNTHLGTVAGDLGNRISDGNQHVLNALHTDSRANGDQIGETKYAAVKSTADASRDVLRAVCDSNMYVAGEISKGTNNVRESIERNGISNLSSTERNGGDTRQAVERNGAQDREAIERNGGDTRLSVERTSAELRALIIKDISSLATAQKDIVKDICEAKGVIVHNQDKGFCETKHAISSSQHVLERQASDNYANLRLQASENTCRLESQADRNLFTLSKQLSDCCCEIKEKITEEGSSTRALVQALDRERLKDELASAKTEGLVNSIVSKLVK